MQQRKGALDGLTVLDLTRVLAGPFCTMMLADMGANVIKVEEPRLGDDTRQFGPLVNHESLYFDNYNRNKRGITLNLKSPRGKDLFKALVAQADLVVENYRPGTMEKLGLGYETLKEINPKIIYGAVSGFGHTGPYRDRAAYDLIGQAMGGIMSITGWPDSGPTKTGNAISDVVGGLSLAVGLLGAVYNRIMTGEGQKVDVSMVDATVATLETASLIYQAEHRIPERIGNRYDMYYPFESFAAKDGEWVIAAGNDKLWQATCQVINRPEMAEAPAFRHVSDRGENYAPIREAIRAWSKDKTVAEAIEELAAAGVPCAPIYNIAQIMHDPHIAGAREMFVEQDHPRAGKIKLTGTPVKFSATPSHIRTPSPALGEHTASVLSSLLGLTEEELKELKDEGTI